MSKTEVLGPEERLQNFLKFGEKYRQRIAQLAVTGSRSLVIDFEDLLTFDSALAKSIIEKPDEYLEYTKKAAWAQLKIEDPEYADEVKDLNVRFRMLPEKVSLRTIGSEHIGKLIMVEGILVRATTVKPLLVEAAFKCRKCGAVQYIEQTGEFLRSPLECTEPSCRRRGAFEFLQEESTFINSQEIRIQERPEDLPPGQLPRSMDVKLLEDLVDIARPGDRVSVTGIARALQEVVFRRGRLRTFELYLEGNYLDTVSKEAEIVQISPEEEKQILELSKDPFIQRKIIRSIAPSIYGYEDVKEAIMYLIFSGVPKTLPDGIAIRGDINLLLIGDPGCLVGDERIILGNGAIVKIADLGNRHLEKIQVQVLTGEGGAKRDVATRFHIYRSQPILEVVTETGKSVKGTYNHPLLVVSKEDGKLVRRWKRLDEIRIGDRLAVVTGFPCTIRKYVETDFAPLQRRLGPKFQGKLPQKVTPELATFLGCLLGDGWVQRYRIGFQVTESERDILPKLCRVATRLFGIRPTVTKRKRPDREVPIYEAIIHSVDIAHNLRFIRSKRVPDLILRSGNDVVSSFLRGLFESDGSVFEKGRGSRAVSLKAKNIELLRDVQLLLLRFGIQARIVGNALLIRRGEDILRFAKSVGFISKKKKLRLANLTIAAQNFHRVHRQRSERVVKIMKHPPEDTFDIEVPKGHRFIVNGIISHNTAKSQLLQYVPRIAPRGLYTSGRGTTAAGLTAAVVREKAGGLVLEAGAVVLADKGICSIDEFDKMRPEDRVAIHEMMEQQTVSVAKGGIVATLNARAAILAAANPALGRYDPYRTMAENINLPITVLSRFDLIFILRDEPERELDAKMSEHILSLHKTGGTPIEPPISPQLLRKYVSYAKRIQPKITDEASKRFEEFYLKMRSVSESRESPVAITPRQLESLVRLAEARARAALRSEVTAEDAEAVIRLMTKSLSQVGIDLKTGEFDIDLIMTGKPKSLRDKLQTVLSAIVEIEKAQGIVPVVDLFDTLYKDYKIERDEANRLVTQLLKEGTIYSPRDGYVKKT